ncbi:hypothetical protein [Bacillus sp. Marseille-P3661]|uniref:hypothetical protein n=1 Tax=Bacillus sp. Marseille-P3661 TaxID=1936234 RepID=UPI000C84C049|nr:hypothetical protein [Bacillus sp. Marseille-P3661]
MDNIKIGQEVTTNSIYFSRYAETIIGEVVNIEREKIWVKNQYNTISIINKLCLEVKERVLNH